MKLLVYYLVDSKSFDNSSTLYCLAANFSSDIFSLDYNSFFLDYSYRHLHYIDADLFYCYYNLLPVSLASSIN